MRRRTRFIIIASAALMVLGLVVSGCAAATGSAPPNQNVVAPSPQPSSPPRSGLVQTSSGGSVTLEVKLLPEKKNAPEFEVVMDTHSVDLDRYDLKELAVLRDAQGREYRPVSWNAPKGGHHRKGKLAFSLDSGGQSRTLELIIRDVAGVKERVLKWEL